MAKSYQGSLTLEWYNKEKAIILQSPEAKKDSDIPAPRLNWVNKEESLFYEISDSEGRGLEPFWVDRNDIRVKEIRPLIFQKGYRAVATDKPGMLPGTEQTYKVEESDVPFDSAQGTNNGSLSAVEAPNMLIRGDNLLALNALVKMFEGKPDAEKVKCIYIDPPFNTGGAFAHYEDSLEHSAWLSLVRDRLNLLYQLLADDGTFYVHIDHNEMGYLILLCDQLFGRNNRVFIATFKQSSASGPKVINPGVVNIASYVICYAKYKGIQITNRVFSARDRDDRYSIFIEHFSKGPKYWQFENLKQRFLKSENLTKEDLKKIDGDTIEKRIEKFVLENASCVARLTRVQPKDVSDGARQCLESSQKTENQVFVFERGETEPQYFMNGQQIAFYSKKTKIIDGQLTTSEPVTNIWTDLLSNNIHKEGEVHFPDGKKPEALLKRILEISTSLGDLVLDCFGGSGTTLAAAHKLGRRYIGVEIGNQAESHIIHRLKRILSGEDQDGISKPVNWKGGGAFQYYHIGPSIIDSAKGDFNWKLGITALQEALLQTYDFAEMQNLDGATLGILRGKADVMAGICSLAAPGKGDEIMHYLDFVRLIQEARKLKPRSIVFFTNRGIEVAEDEKPEDVEIIKVPQAIFAELEK